MILITGASSGLGKALSHAFAKQGAKLLLTARNHEALTQLKATLPTSVEILCADLATADGREQVIAWIHQNSPDLIINNAGFGLYGPVLDHPTKASDAMLDLNAQALMDLTIEGARALKKANKPGTILNIASAAAFFSYPTFCVYAATKAFVLRFSEGINAELRPFGIHVLTACPGQIDTPFREHASPHVPQTKDRLTMPIAKAVAILLHQIDTKKPVQLFDTKYRLLILLARALPRRWLQSLLKNSLKDRY
jgi:hypothetical protein